MPTQGLLTDLYELTMAAAYLGEGKTGDTATFDLYFRRNPYDGGYAIAAGLESAIRAVIQTRYSREDIAFLESLRTSAGSPLFSRQFLEYLSRHRFGGTIRAVPEGTVVFPNEPLVQVSGSLIDCQIIETLLLFHINFQTLIATKAARIWEAANHGTIVEFGLRRAQGPDGALSGCRAAYIGGVEATSNVLAAALLNMPARGTHAHSLVQSFPSELEAFRAFARSFPDDCVLLVDTYDVLASGVPHAIRVARELEREGHRLAGIRIDSGDLAFLSQAARAALDSAGLDYVRIVASNELDEFAIAEIIAAGGKVDTWGVGTRLITGGGPGGGALGGIYKLVEHNCRPKIKLSGNPAKMTMPGSKKVVRFFSADGLMEADAVALRTELLPPGEVLIIDPINPLRRKKLDQACRIELLRDIVVDGRLAYEFPSLEQIRARRREQLSGLHESYRRLRNPHEYKVGLTRALWRKRAQMLNRAMV